MDWRTLFTLQHHQVHSRALSGDGNDFHIPDALLHGMCRGWWCWNVRPPRSHSHRGPRIRCPPGRRTQRLDDTKAKSKVAQAKLDEAKAAGGDKWPAYVNSRIPRLGVRGICCQGSDDDRPAGTASTATNHDPVMRSQTCAG